MIRVLVVGTGVVQSALIDLCMRSDGFWFGLIVVELLGLTR